MKTKTIQTITPNIKGTLIKLRGSLSYRREQMQMYMNNILRKETKTPSYKLSAKFEKKVMQKGGEVSKRDT